MKNYVLVKKKQIDKFLDAVAESGQVDFATLGPSTDGGNHIALNGKVVNVIGELIIVFEEPEKESANLVNGIGNYERDLCDKI